MKDIKQTIDGDIDVSGNDIHYTEATQQHQKDLLLTIKGELKDMPGVGVGAIDFINDDDSDSFLTEVRTEFRKDGMTVNEVSYLAGKIRMEAFYATN